VKAFVLRLATPGLLLPLAACTALSGLGGESHYACKAPEGVACDSVSSTYANAIHNNLPSQRAPRSGDRHNQESEAGAAGSVLRTTSFAPGSSIASTAEPTVGLAQPLRSQARVLRLWIKPWEDADGDLYDQGYVYVQVDGGRWLIDHVQRQIREAYAPLKAPPRPANEAAAEPQPGVNPPTTPLLLQRAAAPGGAATRSE
jgi:conjugal transfer pilus assembly protein TraV